MYSAAEFRELHSMFTAECEAGCDRTVAHKLNRMFTGPGFDRIFAVFNANPAAEFERFTAYLDLARSYAEHLRDRATAEA